MQSRPVTLPALHLFSMHFSFADIVKVAALALLIQFRQLKQAGEKSLIK